MKIDVMKANINHKDFIIYANNIINNVNSTYQTNGLEKNIDKDYYSENPKFSCLVAEVNKNPVGMILYSKF